MHVYLIKQLYLYSENMRMIPPAAPLISNSSALMFRSYNSSNKCTVYQNIKKWFVRTTKQKYLQLQNSHYWYDFIILQSLNNISYDNICEHIECVIFFIFVFLFVNKWQMLIYLSIWIHSIYFQFSVTYKQYLIECRLKEIGLQLVYFIKTKMRPISSSH